MTGTTIIKGVPHKEIATECIECEGTGTHQCETTVFNQSQMCEEIDQYVTNCYECDGTGVVYDLVPFNIWQKIKLLIKSYFKGLPTFKKRIIRYRIKQEIYGRG